MDKLNWLYAVLGIGGIGAILNIILKKLITNELLGKWGKGIKILFKGLGITCTIGLSKIPYLKGLWNNVFEPYVIILLKLVFQNSISGFIEGLESDNKSLKDD